MKTYLNQKVNYINEEEEGDSGAEELCRMAKYKEDLFFTTIQENQEVCDKILRDKEIYKMNLFMKIVYKNNILIKFFSPQNYPKKLTKITNLNVLRVFLKIQ